MAETIKLVQGDDLPGVSLVIRDYNTAALGKEFDKKDPSTWAVVDLTGAVVSALVAIDGSTSALESVSCSVVDASNGLVLISFLDSTFLEKANEYRVELTVEFPEGQQTVYDTLPINVRERIKNAS